MKKRYLRPISKAFLLFTERNELIVATNETAGDNGGKDDWISDDINQYRDFGDEDTDWVRRK